MCKRVKMIKMVNMYEEIILTEMFLNKKILRCGTVGYGTVGWNRVRHDGSNRTGMITITLCPSFLSRLIS